MKETYGAVSFLINSIINGIYFMKKVNFLLKKIFYTRKVNYSVNETIKSKLIKSTSRVTVLNNF